MVEAQVEVDEKLREIVQQNFELFEDLRVNGCLGLDTDEEIEFVKEALIILIGEDLLENQQAVKKFVTNQFETKFVDGKTFQLPPNVSALSDVFG